MKQPFFSIIIPTLNEEAYLPALLKDLAKQSMKDFSVMVVDGSSVDHTKEYAQKFKKDLDLHFYSVKTRNVSFQRNTGADYAKGKYLFFLDADCRLEKDCLKKTRQYLEKHKKLFLIPRMLPQTAEKELYDEYIFNALNYLIEISQLTNKPFSSGGWMVVERSLFHFLEGFSQHLYLSEDHDLVQRARNAGVKASVPKDLFVYVSMRRFQREGRLRVISKYLVSTIKTVRGQSIDTKIFEYEMGGHPYALSNKDEVSLSTKLRQYALKVKDAMTS